MSLNGLDDPKVAEAYEAASGEPGGWFLLKYSSRDQVDMLASGNGGVAELRAEVSEYDEQSPLYGFLKYRRRNVLIKYLPEGCSRLIQARVAVHFNAVCDRFSPYDSQFDITTPEELRDSKLTTACSLHTASASSSSSSGSLRRKHLMEIAEEDEDDPDQDQQQPAKRQSLIKEKDSVERPATPKKHSQQRQRQVDQDPVKLDADLASSPEHSKFSAPNTSEVPSFVGAVDSIDAATAAAAAADDDDDDDDTADPARRLSSQSGRPEVFTSYSSYSSYSSFGKAKVKLGPRPSLDSANTRPQTAGNFRPVSSIPAGYKLLGNKHAQGSAKKSSSRPRKDSTVSTTSTVLPDSARLTDIAAASPPTPDSTDNDNNGSSSSNNLNVHGESGNSNPYLVTSRPATSSGVSTKSSASKQAMTPEKARLKKAMQMREKRKKAAATAGTQPIPDVPTSTTTTTTTAAAESTSTPTGAGIDEDAVEATITIEEITSASTDEENEAMTKSDSGVAIDTSNKEMDGASETTPDQSQSESGPSSPAMGQQSTNASSVSEVTAAGDEEDKTSDTSLSSGSTPKPSEAQRSEDAPPSAEADPAGPDDGQGETPTVTRDIAPATAAAGGPTTTRQLQPRKFVEPIRTDLANNRPTSMNFSDSESLLEELQSATVQEAKPMLMAKTPRTPSFPIGPAMSGPADGTETSTSPGARPVSNGKPYAVRTVSNPVRGTSSGGGDGTGPARAVSQGGAAYLSQVTQQRGGDAALAAKKSSMMGSSISQRIKALEQLSAKGGDAPGPGGGGSSLAAPSSAPRPSSTFFSVKKDRVPSRSPSVVDRTSSLSGEQRAGRPTTAQSRDVLPDGTLRPARDRSSSISSRLSMFEPTTSPVGTPRGRPETVSVTAKILRDSPPGQQQQQPQQDHPDLKQSPLLVNHQRSSSTMSHVAAEAAAAAAAAAAQSADHAPSDHQLDMQARRSSSSFSIMRDFIKEGRKPTAISSPSTDNLGLGLTSPTLSSSGNSFTRRLSIGGSSHRSQSKDRNDVTSDDETRSQSDKKKSRATRFMHRLSSLSGSSRGSKMSSPTASGTPTTVREEAAAGITATLLPPINPSPSASQPLAPPPAADPSAPSIVSAMGDVNVQFPDTLLWKRRDMCLDSQGFVVFSTTPAGRPQSQHASSQLQQRNRRFHLADFKTPAIPDVEVQELPNSVVLEIVGGSAVQVACESRSGQMSVLKTLRDAHATYAGQ